MSWITYITDETNKRRLVQIDLDEVKAHEEELEDLFDALIAESRKDEANIPFQEVINEMKSEGKL
jgi:quinol monooxygenase YgiN